MNCVEALCSGRAASWAGGADRSILSYASDCPRATTPLEHLNAQGALGQRVDAPPVGCGGVKAACIVA